MNAKKAILILAAAAGAATTVYADKVALSATPPAVQQAIRSRSGSREVEDIDRDNRNGQVSYEASWKNASGVQQELLVSNNGNILRDVPADPSAASNPVNQSAPTGGRGWRARYGTADANLPLSNGQKLTLEQAPENVRTTITRMAHGAQIEDLERGIANGRTIYEAAYKVNGQNTELQVYDDGSLVRTQASLASSTTAALPASRGATNWAPRYAGLADGIVPLTSPQNMSLNQAPRPVQLTMNRLAGGSYVSAFQKGSWNGQVVYDAKFQQNGQNMEIQALEDGSLITKGPITGTSSTAQNASSTTSTGAHQSFFDRAASFIDRFNGSNNAAGSNVSLAQAPAAVQQTVNQTAKGAAIQSLQQEQWNGRTVYSATFPQNGQNMRLQVFDDGSILNMGPASAVGNAPASQTGTLRQ